MRAEIRLLPCTLAVTSLLGFLAGTAWAQTGLYAGSKPDFPVPAKMVNASNAAQDAVWLGGDGPYACPIDPANTKTCFWTFCDIGVGPNGSVDRTHSYNQNNQIAGNSIALADCSGGNFKLQHYYRTLPNGRIAPFFQDPDNPDNNTPQDMPGATRLWPRKAYYNPSNGGLYVFAQQAYSGGILNTVIIRVRNPKASPWQWTIDTVRLYKKAFDPKVSSNSIKVYFGTDAEFASDGFVYTYGIYNPNPDNGDFGDGFAIFPYRIPASAIDNAQANQDIGSFGQYMDAAGNWRATTSDWHKNPFSPPDNYYHVGIDAFNGFSVRYNADLAAATGAGYQVVFNADRQLYGINQPNNITTYTANGVSRTGPKPFSPTAMPDYKTYALGNRDQVYEVYVMSGPTRYGPWNTPKLAGIFPQMQQDGAANLKSQGPGYPYNPDMTCYTAREVPEFAVLGNSKDVALSFTYSTNSYLISYGNPQDNSVFKYDNSVYRPYWYPTCSPLFGGCSTY